MKQNKKKRKKYMNKTLPDDPLLISTTTTMKKSYKRLRNMLFDSGNSLEPTSKLEHTHKNQIYEKEQKQQNNELHWNSQCMIHS